MNKDHVSLYFLCLYLCCILYLWYDFVERKRKRKKKEAHYPTVIVKVFPHCRMNLYTECSMSLFSVCVRHQIGFRNAFEPLVERSFFHTNTHRGFFICDSICIWLCVSYVFVYILIDLTSSAFIISWHQLNRWEEKKTGEQNQQSFLVN